MAESTPNLDNDAMNDRSNDRVSRALTRLGKFAALVFAVGFVGLMAIGFSIDEPTTTNMVVVGICVAVVFLSGMACVLFYFSRELVAWKRDRWRFSVGQLMFWMTLVAVGLALARFHFFAE